MKTAFTILSVLLVAAACRKDLAPTTPLQEMVDTTTAVVQLDASFENGPYGSVMGDVKIYLDSNRMFRLNLVNIMISNGPDLHVYLSREVQPLNFIDLGKIKSTSGNQVYTISGTPDFSLYKYVLIHCQKYNHLFGSAALK